MGPITVAIGVGWVVSPSITLVINKIEKYIENNYFKRAGIDDEMEDMNRTLTEIYSTMSMVEKVKKVANQHQTKMVQKIKDAVYEAEDAIDEFEYDILDREKKSEEAHITQVALWSSSTYDVLFCNPSTKNKLKAINKNLDRAKVSAELLFKQLNGTNNDKIKQKLPENSYVTSSHITGEIIGRNREREELIDLLFKNEDQLLAIIPIIADGGIGKTTLAQMIYNDQRVTERFERIWVYVSNNFDKDGLTMDMLKQASDNLSPVNGSFPFLQNKLKELIESKNRSILLVLDDVWYHKKEDEQESFRMDWNQVLSPFKNVKQRNRVILTTRLPIVGKLLGSIKQESLNGLNDSDSWSLFKLWAFDDENQSNLPKLEPIGKQILKKLKGSALAIRVIGGQLRGNSDLKHWERTSNDNPLETSDIMSILYRSYEQLPGHLQHCFAYCSLFPKGYHLEPDRLVHMWMAHGFVEPHNTKSLEEVGRGYFNNLLAGSFIQSMKLSKNEEYYVMHDHMNDLACHVSGADYHILKQDDSIKSLGPIRHLSLSTPKAIDVLRNMNGLDKLRTLIFVEINSSDIDIAKVASKATRVRVFDMGYHPCSLEILTNLYECKHLRYLSFVVPKYNIPPNNKFNKFHHLSALFMRYGSDANTAAIAKGICDLSNLIVIDSDRALHMIHVDAKILGKLSFWRGPVCFCVAEKYRLDILGDMSGIRGTLEIKGLENVTCREEAMRAQLGRKELVTKLTLNYSKVCSLELETNELTKYQVVLEVLIPHPNLKTLNITGYPGGAWPSWLESDLLSKIIEITLRDISKLETLPALGQLPRLQVLVICELNDVINIGLEFYGNGTFPSLKILEISNMGRLKKWSHPPNVSIFPKLHKLSIKHCPFFIASELNAFPVLAQLSIKSCFKEMTIEAELEGYFVKALPIEHWKERIALDSLRMVFLKRLFISECPNLSSLPKMESFKSLKFLAIFKCPELKSLSETGGLPVSLKLLFIGETHAQLEEQILQKKGPDWDKISAISGCDFYTSILEKRNGILSCLK